jgi:hypothetical protein
LTFRLLFGFVVLRHHRRELIHICITDQPTAAWAAQQIVHAFPDETGPTYLLRDRDAIYATDFQRRVELEHSPRSSSPLELSGRGALRYRDNSSHVGHSGVRPEKVITNRMSSNSLFLNRLRISWVFYAPNS